MVFSRFFGKSSDAPPRPEPDQELEEEEAPDAEIETSPEKPRHLVSIRGTGYRFDG